MNRYQKDISWSTVESCLDTLVPSMGGFTNAKRGFVTLPDGNTIFVKVGIDPVTRLWANKEVEIYTILSEQDYAFIPKVVSINEDANGFALENLSSEAGWEWETNWSEARLNKTLEAMDSLAQLDAASIPLHLLDIHMINEQKNPWLRFVDDPSAIISLKIKLKNIGRLDLVEAIIHSGFLQSNFDFHFTKDALVHNDVRRDNCAWNQHTQQVKLVDWNWLQLGNRDIDVNSLLVNVYKSGLKLPGSSFGRLNKDALLWLAGYWFSNSVQSSDATISEDVSSLRDYQLESAVCAYELALSL